MENQQKKSPRYVRVTGTITAHTSAMHAELHQQLYSLVAAQDKQKLHLTDELLKAWNDLIAQEVELNNAQQDTELTAKMQQLDDDRDALITQIFSAIRSNRRSPVKALREPAERLVKLVDSYKGIQREVLQAESMHINGMLKDLGKYSTETAALGLTAVIAMLKTTNEEFERLELKRLDGSDKSGFTSAKAVRPLTDDTFYEVRGNIEAAFYFATTEADKKLITNLVNNLNAVLARYATSRKSSKAQLDIAKEMELENNHKRIDPLLPALAAKAGHAAGDLSFTGRTQIVKKETRYEVLAASTGKTLWTRLVGGELALVKTKPSAKSNGSATVKPKGKKTGKGDTPSKDEASDKGGHASDKGNGSGSDDASGKGKNPGGGQGEAEIKPKG